MGTMGGIAAGVSRSRCVAELLTSSHLHGTAFVENMSHTHGHPCSRLCMLQFASICFVERVQDRYALHFNTWRRVYRL